MQRSCAAVLGGAGRALHQGDFFCVDGLSAVCQVLSPSHDVCAVQLTGPLAANRALHELLRVGGNQLLLRMFAPFVDARIAEALDLVHGGGGLGAAPAAGQLFCLFVCLSVSIGLTPRHQQEAPGPVCVSVSLCVSVCVSVSVCVALSLSVSVCIGFGVVGGLYVFSLCLSACLPAHVSVCLSLCLSVSLSVCLSVCMRLRLSL